MRFPCLFVAVVLLLSPGASAQFLPPPSISIPGGMSPRANQMKADARNTRDSENGSSKAATKPATVAAPPQASKMKTTSSDNAAGYPTATSSVNKLATEGKVEEMKVDLAAHPEEVKKKDSDGFTALHHAAVGGHLDAVQLLLTSGSVVNAQGIRGETPLYLAATGGKTDIIEALLAAGADPNLATLEMRTPLQKAAMDSNLAAVKALLKGGADAKLRDKQGRSALDLAERYNHGADGNRVVAALLEAR